MHGGGVMKVHCVIGIRDGVPYEDMGADELISVWADPVEAEAEVVSLKTEMVASSYSEKIKVTRLARLGYDDAEVVEHSVNGIAP